MNPPDLHHSPDPTSDNALSAEQLLDCALVLTNQDMHKVDRTIQSWLDSDIALIKTMSAYILKSGGKRMRPLVVLLSAKACNYQGDEHVLLAAVIEFVHTATLLHDDVVDASAMRRGQPTANDVWGNEASVLVGDFLYSRAFEMMVQIKRMEVMRIMAATTNAIAEGEVLQLLNAHSPQTSERAYLETIHRKTAKLFESAALLGGVISQQDAPTCQTLGQYGIYLGTAFQLVDDVMDYAASSETMGKDAGDDLAEGNPTLPLIHAMRVGKPKQKRLLQTAIEQGQREQINAVLEIVNATGALEYTMRQANQQAELAITTINRLPESDYKQALIKLARFTVNRNR